MTISEKLAQAISKTISDNMDFDQEKREVIAYGALALIHTFWSFLVIVIVGYFMNILLPITIITIVVAMLRKFSGGAHCTTPNRCTVGGAVIFTVLAYLVKIAAIYASSMLYHLYMLIGFAVSFVLVIQLSPVDSPNKPIRKEETKKRLRLRAVTYLVFCALLISFFVFANSLWRFRYATVINLSITTGLLWQSFTLTNIGHRFTNVYDNLLSYVVR
ncbi:MAG: accessory gene regulator ArgB-like protein [Clostridia bacterium]|jgi:accessory gene regulator B